MPRAHCLAGHPNRQPGSQASIEISYKIQACLSRTQHKAVLQPGRLFQKPYIASIGVTPWACLLTSKHFYWMFQIALLESTNQVFVVIQPYCYRGVPVLLVYGCAVNVSYIYHLCYTRQLIACFPLLWLIDGSNPRWLTNFFMLIYIMVMQKSSSVKDPSRFEMNS